MSVTIYHNPRCSKSRQTLTLLQDQGVDPEVVEYLKTPLSQAAVKKIVRQLNISAADLVRKKEKLFKELCPDGELTDAQAIRLLAEHPRLMERPVVVAGNAAAIGRPPENVLDLLQ